MIRKPEFDAEASEVYGEVLDTLDEVGIRYMLGGALALNTYTRIWRDTKDLDVFTTERTVPRVLEVLEEAGFETEVTDPVWLAKAHRGELFADVIHASHNGTGLVDESWFENATEISILGRRALVIPAEELILSKIFVVAKDRCDVDDVLHVIFATRGELDWDRIVGKIGDHWELLLAYLHLYRYVYPSHTHYLPGRVFNTLLGRYEAEPAPKETRFRGTMLDENTFRVDVEEWDLPDERAAKTEARRSGEEKR
jgi:predicted nucleotidyltransferase